jgi:hypothetical protein
MKSLNSFTQKYEVPYNQMAPFKKKQQVVMKYRKFLLKYGYLPTYTTAAFGLHIYVILCEFLLEMTTKKQKLGMYVTRINDIKFS